MTTPKLGEGTCSCAGCGRYFTSTGTFDKHRAWSAGNGAVWQGKNRPADFDQRVCIDPTHPSVGLVLNARGCYGGPPMTDEQKAARGWTTPMQHAYDTREDA